MSRERSGQDATNSGPIALNRDLVAEKHEVAVTIEKRFVAVSDVLGFTSLLQRTPLTQVVQQYVSLTSVAQPRNYIITSKSLDTKQRHTETTQVGHAVFSDTILFWAGSDHWSVQAFFEQLTALLSESIKLFVPLRVGIAYGECEIAPTQSLYVGQAIVDAHQTEASQDWIGGACHATCHDSPWFDHYIVHEFDMAFEYPLPTKMGDKSGLAVNWVNPYNGLTYLSWEFMDLLERGKSQADVPQAKVKWENAITFFNHCLQRKGSGDHPIQKTIS